LIPGFSALFVSSLRALCVKPFLGKMHSTMSTEGTEHIEFFASHVS
jgi:hypothetical protein